MRSFAVLFSIDYFRFIVPCNHLFAYLCAHFSTYQLIHFNIHFFQSFSAKHPMHCFNFLKLLHAHLDAEKNPEKTEKNSKKKAPPKKIVTQGVVGTRTTGLQLMTTLALTYAHMSKMSVLVLEVRTFVRTCGYFHFAFFFLVLTLFFNMNPCCTVLSPSPILLHPFLTLFFPSLIFSSFSYSPSHLLSPLSTLFSPLTLSHLLSPLSPFLILSLPPILLSHVLLECTITVCPLSD